MIEVGSEFVLFFYFKSTFAGFEVGSGPFAAHRELQQWLCLA